VPARVVHKKKLFAVEPNLNKSINAALFFPSAGIVCPYSLTIALAENAVQNGVRLSLDTAVTGMTLDQESRTITAVQTNRGTLHPRVVINAAGVWADVIAEYAGDQFYTIHPRRGTNAIVDKKAKIKIANTIVATMGANISTKGRSKTHSKGGGIISTADGNILVGPDAIETWERENYATRKTSIQNNFEKFRGTSPELSEKQIITYFTGVRAPVYEEDFIVEPGRRTRNIIHAAGIQSPGLTAAPAIAEDVARWAADMLGTPQLNTGFNPQRCAIPKVSEMTDAERDAFIKLHPDYGVILCRCEEVSKGEILESLRRAVPCDTVDGVKRRVRPGMGRCQGGFCGPLITSLIAAEKGLRLEDVLKSGYGSAILTGRTK
jgi:glycerol-3-phosphate dehydrogenase